MPSFKITPRDDNAAPVIIDAERVEEAATIYARRLYSGDVFAHRETGTPRLSGMFQAYRNLPRSSAGTRAAAVGAWFHAGPA